IMKLFLSSYQLGNHPEELAKLFGSNKKIAVICNARDYDFDEADYKKKQEEQVSNLKNIGLDPEILDLRNYFGKEEELRNILNKLGGIWVRGGNTFVLRIAYKLSGLDTIILDYSRTRSDFVYGGFSAGVCVLQKNLKGIDFIDNPNLVKSTYKNERILWNGLGIIEYVFVPHFQSDHLESKNANLEVEYYKKNNIPYKTIRDGEVIIEVN
ncbi:MAG: Type 1 glutamine amidotransferase-like domain-containing protein, partial [Candidatus Dojkabacteria bacterium]